MSMEWFKLYHDLPDHPALRRLSPQEKWAWVAILCLASKSKTRGLITHDDEDIADYCDFNTKQDWLYYRDKLIAKGMLEITDRGLSIVHWDEKQQRKPSDKPEAVKKRVQKHRDKKKAEKTQASNTAENQLDPPVTTCNALQVQCNAGETPQIRLDKRRLDKDLDIDIGFTLTSTSGEEEASAKKSEKAIGVFQEELSSRQLAEGDLPHPAPLVEQRGKTVQDQSSGNSSKKENSQSWQEFYRLHNRPPWRTELGDFHPMMLRAVHQSGGSTDGRNIYDLPNGEINKPKINKILRKLDTSAGYSGYSTKDSSTCELQDFWELACQLEKQSVAPPRASKGAGIVDRPSYQTYADLNYQQNLRMIASIFEESN